MILTVEEVRRFVTTDESDTGLEVRLQALESFIRKATNNNFMDLYSRCKVDIVNGTAQARTFHTFDEGDTVQITDALFNRGLYTVSAVDGNSFSLAERVQDEPGVTVTRVKYPAEVKMGVVELLKWDMTNREKVGIQSETISRHSVTYAATDGNGIGGYPKALTAFLLPYRRAYFGQGVI